MGEYQESQQKKDKNLRHSRNSVKKRNDYLLIPDRAVADQNPH